jgi:hypothetical protein
VIPLIFRRGFVVRRRFVFPTHANWRKGVAFGSVEGIYGIENLVKERERVDDLHNLSLGRSPKIANIDTTFDCPLPDMLP